MMRRGASHHADEAWRKTFEKLYNLAASSMP
jgi:hypothetical protein